MSKLTPNDIRIIREALAEVYGDFYYGLDEAPKIRAIDIKLKQMNERARGLHGGKKRK